ncbi:MAG: biotin--[acetyl-CoA-carboxylase] ligase [Anaerolineales bacterium]
MDQENFQKAIAGLPLQKSAFFASIGSTNDMIAEWARAGESGLCLAVADEQTRGRGRAGRRWFTPPGGALAMSLLLDLAPSFDQAFLGWASGLGALAVCEAIESLYMLSPKIKWPNDVLLGGKKVCGVLPEAHWSGEHLQALILGVGINVAASSVPPKQALNFPATSIEGILGKQVQTAVLLRAILEHILGWKDRLHEPEFINAWEGRLAYKNERVRLDAGDGNIVEAMLEGLSSEGSLKLRLANGNLRAFQAGEIQLRPVVASEDIS